MAKATLADLATMAAQRAAINGNFTELYKFANNERFQGKKILVAGDSITEFNFRATLNWHDYLMTWFGFTERHNEAKSGSGLLKIGGSSNNMVTRVDTWPTDVDYIMIMGNMNDGVYTGGAGVPVGTFGDIYPTNSTVYGCAAYIIEKCIERMPLVPMVWISSTPRAATSDLGLDYGAEGWFTTYLTALKKVCHHYNVPFLDLYNESGLRPFNAAHNAEYFSTTGFESGDGIHPNAEGQLIMARKIAEFIKQYL